MLFLFFNKWWMASRIIATKLAAATDSRNGNVTEEKTKSTNNSTNEAAGHDRCRLDSVLDHLKNGKTELQ